MVHTTEVERYVKNPDLLLKLLHDVIEFLESEDDQKETTAMEAQLREISKAMENLEKKGITVPDAFRAEKTRLAAILGTQSESIQVLSHLYDELDEIMRDLKIRLGHSTETTQVKRTRNKRSNLPKTDKKILRKLIVDALLRMGGSAHIHEVLKYVGEQLNDKLLPGDLVWRESTKQFAWQNNTQWERYFMIRGGILKANSPKGFWELSEEHK
jgi:hypothetical protein